MKMKANVGIYSRSSRRDKAFQTCRKGIGCLVRKLPARVPILPIPPAISPEYRVNWHTVSYNHWIHYNSSHKQCFRVNCWASLAKCLAYMVVDISISSLSFFGTSRDEKKCVPSLLSLPYIEQRHKIVWFSDIFILVHYILIFGAQGTGLVSMDWMAPFWR